MNGPVLYYLSQTRYLKLLVAGTGGEIVCSHTVREKYEETHSVE